MIEGVVITPLHQIFDERGKVMHMLRKDSPIFSEFGEIYFESSECEISGERYLILRISVVELDVLLIVYIISISDPIITVSHSKDWGLICIPLAKLIKYKIKNGIVISSFFMIFFIKYTKIY